MCQSKEYQKACQERERAKAKQLEEVQAKKLEEVQIESVESEEVSIVKQSDVINPYEIDGKREFGFEIGDVLAIKYVSDDPPKGCSWMKDATFNAKVEK